METSQGRQRYDVRSRDRRNYDYYVDGSTVRKLDVTKEIEKAPRKKVSHTTRRNREKATHMNMGYVAFLAVALCLTSYLLISYIQLQAQNTVALETIAQKESQLNAMKIANEEEYSRITSAVDLEYVKDVAINELGMQYAQEGQIIEVEMQGDDYVRQYEDMP